MWIVYSALAFAEVCVLFASVIALLLFAMRGVFRLLRRPKDDQRKVARQDGRSFVTRPASQTSSV